MRKVRCEVWSKGYVNIVICGMVSWVQHAVRVCTSRKSYDMRCISMFVISRYGYVMSLESDKRCAVCQ